MEHEAFIAEEYVSVLPEGINLALEAKIEVEFDQTTAQYIRLAFSSNTGAGGGQLAEFEVYGE